MKEYTVNDLGFPLVMSPAGESVDLLSWAKSARKEIREHLNTHGAILFRGFDISEVETFEQFVAAATGDDWVEYREAATPRSHVKGQVFTSTEYPASESIFYHNENSHTTTWPLYLAFYCQTPADKGGATPLSDCRKIYKEIPQDVKDLFESKQVKYARNFGHGLGIHWLKGFPVNSKEEMQDYCAKYDMYAKWSGDDKLSLTYRRWASLTHPVTNDKVWFNHATFFNFFSLAEETQSLISQYIGKEHSPYDTFFGDGLDIDKDTIHLLKSLYEKYAVSVPYEKNDILLIDNMLVAHGREPFSGERKVYVTMTQQQNHKDFQF